MEGETGLAESKDVDMKEDDACVADDSGAQTTSWDEFLRTGRAEGEYTYILEGIDKLISEQDGGQNKIRSNEFDIAAFSWNLLLFPQGSGNSRQPMPSMSIFLQLADSKYLPPADLPEASFTLTVINRVKPEDSISKDSQHKFTANEDDWGFADFVKINALNNARDEFMPDGNLHIKVKLEVKLEEKYTGMTRQVTGYVGLKNQGATCYMNSLLQTLYHVAQFRRAVYHMPTAEGEEPESSIPLALKRLFYKLEYSQTPVSTKQLVKSFGWTTGDAFVQQDVEELELKLCDKLEEKMKGTIVDKDVDRLLKGKTCTILQCMHVDFKSTKQEEFIDLQLDVLGCKSVYDSLEAFCKTEDLTGDNKWNAEGHGLQDTRKGSLFQELPPVLQLHLKRFNFDYQTWTPYKVNSRYEFTETLEFKDELMAPDADRSVKQVYKLFSVLVHSGASGGGHYYAYIRASDGRWCKFDDETVSHVDQAEAIEQQFGDDGPRPAGLGNYPRRVMNNAYMLVYIRESDWESVMAPTTGEEVELAVREQLKAELAAKEHKRRERMQAHRYVTFKVVTEDLVRNHVEKAAFQLLDLTELPDENTLKLEKTCTWAEAMEQIAEVSGVPPAKQLYWQWQLGDNGTYRPSSVIDPHELATQAIKHKHRDLILLHPRARRPLSSMTDPIVIFVRECSVGMREAISREPQQAHRLVFLKEYVQETRQLRLHSAVLVEPDTPVEQLLSEEFGGVADNGQPKRFLAWAEARTDTVLDLAEIDTGQPVDRALEHLHGDVVIAQCYTGPTPKSRRTASQPEPQIMSSPADIARQAAEVGKAAARDSLAGGAADVGAKAEAVSAEAGADSDMHDDTAAAGGVTDDTSESSAAAGSSVFDTAFDFLTHLHSLRRITCMPLPGSQPRTAVATSASGEGDGGAPAAAPAQLPRAEIEVQKNASYADVVVALSDKLRDSGVSGDPGLLRLTQHNTYTGMPSRCAIPSGRDFLSKPTSYASPFQLYYEVLDMPLEEVEKLKALRVRQVKANTEVVRNLTLRLSPSATVRDLLDKVLQQSAPKYAETNRVRAVKIYNQRIFEVCAEDAPIADIDTTYWTLRVEPVPPDDAEAEARCAAAGAEPVLALFSHSKAVEGAADGQLEDYGDPLALLLHPDDTLGQARDRIRQRLKVEGIEEWQWAVHLSRPVPLTDMDAKVADSLSRAASNQSKFEHLPYVSMIHEQKGYAARAPRHESRWGQEAQINIS